jgi:hypothetical protein
MSLISDIRLDVADDGATQRLTDAQYIGLFQKAARRLNREMSLVGSDAIVVNDSGVITSSDPDARIHDLLLLQAECLLASRDFTNDLNSGAAGISVSDGEQSLDNRGSATARQALFDSQNSPCAQLKEALTNYKLERVDGKLIW